MKTDKITPRDLFEKHHRYLVPLFQRGYVWDEEDQWEPLWQDILHQVHLAEAPAFGKTDGHHAHFLGAVVLNPVSMGVKHVSTSEVIDGQQRLTTLQVLLVAFRDVAEPLGDGWLNDSLNRLTRNPGHLYDPDEQYKVWPTNAFREELRAITDAGSVTEVERRYPRVRSHGKWLPRPRLVEAYLYFAEQISSYVNPTQAAVGQDATFADGGPSRASALLEGILARVQIIEISLDPDDDPQTVFETLNARGTPLTPGDLVRNFVFLAATRSGDDVPHLYDQYWKEFDEARTKPKQGVRTARFWEVEERQGRIKSSRLDLLLFHFVLAQTGQELRIGELFEVFKDWWRDADTSTEQKLASLKRAANLYRCLIDPDLGSAFGQFATRVRALDTSTAYPLVLALAECELPPVAFDGMLRDLESFLVRRAVCGLPTNNYNRVFLGVIQSLREAGGTPSRELLQEFLGAFKGDSSKWPTDDEFRAAWLNRPIYLELGPLRTRMILLAVEAGMRTKMQESQILDEGLSVEHVWPQNGYPQWPSTVSTFQDEPAEAAITHSRQQLIQTIGNLTLLTTKLNSSVSNGAFVTKRPAIAKQSVLLMNNYFQDLGPHDSWDETAIRNRGEALFVVARQVWPGPL